MAQKYMFALFGDEAKWANATEAEYAEGMRLHTEFAAAVEAAGAKIVGGEELRLAATATTVRTGDAPLVSDGPFMESKEAFGGFYLIEADDLDQAIALAKICPEPAVEIRPVVDHSEA
ncbi:YciI family protein [Solicola gregarius]|uniref:YciI family protein n=1 Tax=Solicola gregarius TaxID=2908642 RepID=A0AA46TGP9_9ACTN|nr:YciI family protein [Solicola gregarius]UYM04472.1 YciI family protein [Solicola gregarius]